MLSFNFNCVIVFYETCKQNLFCCFIATPLSLSDKGELQTILCLGFGSADTVFSGTLSGDIYQWKGHTLASVIKGAHNVSHMIDCQLIFFTP